MDLFDVNTLGLAGTAIGKIMVAMLLGGVVGWQRERRGRPGGLRTQILVALGVVLYCLVSAAYPGSDPTRISAQVVTGIGFLGAGTIMRNNAEVVGLTSAASIWATSAIAMAVARGGSYTWVAMVATVLAVITLEIVRKLEPKIRINAMATEMIATLQKRTNLQDLLEEFDKAGIEVKAMRIIQTVPEMEVAIEVIATGAQALHVTATVPGVANVRIADTVL